MHFTHQCISLVFAVAVDPDAILMFDSRCYERGAFATFHVSGAAKQRTLSFSPDGQYLVVGGETNQFLVLDAFSGDVLNTLVGSGEVPKDIIRPTVSPDGQYVAAGSTDGLVNIWELTTGKAVTSLRAGHPGTIQWVEWNPAHLQLASACSEIALWLSDTDSS